MKVWQQIKLKIRRIDIFGKRTQLRLCKKSQHKSEFGGIITIILTLLICGAIYNYGFEIIYRQSPSRQINEQLNNNSMHFILQNFNNSTTVNAAQQINSVQNASSFIKSQYQNFDLLINVFDASTNQPISDKGVFQIVSNNIIITESSDSPIIEQEILSNNCIELRNNPNEQLSNQFKELHLESMFCLKNNQQYGIGQQTSPKIEQRFEIQFLLCQTGSQCKNQSEIENIFENMKIEIFFIDVFFDQSDYDNPERYYLRKTEILPDVYFDKSFIFLMESVTISSDSGMFITDIHEKSFIKFSSLQSDFKRMLQNNDTSKPKTFATLNFRLQQLAIVQTRSYIKIITLLALIGGLAKTSYYLLLFLTKPVRDLLYYKDIVNEVFNIKDKQQFNQNAKVQNIQIRKPQRNNSKGTFIKVKNYIQGIFKEKLNSKQKNIETATAANQTSLFQGSLSENNQIIQQKERQTSIPYSSYATDKEFHEEQLRNFLEFQQSKIRLGFCDYLQRIVFGKKKIKKHAIREGLRRIDGKLDIVYILNKLGEIDKLKMLLLDQHQLQLFEFLPKPVIYELNNGKLSQNAKKSIQPQQVNIENIGDFQNHFFSEMPLFEKATLAFNSYQLIKQQEQLTPLDARLIDLLDEQVKSLFNINQDEKMKSLIENYQRQQACVFQTLTNNDSYLSSKNKFGSSIIDDSKFPHNQNLADIQFSSDDFVTDQSVKSIGGNFIDQLQKQKSEKIQKKSPSQQMLSLNMQSFDTIKNKSNKTIIFGPAKSFFQEAQEIIKNSLSGDNIQLQENDQFQNQISQIQQKEPFQNIGQKNIENTKRSKQNFLDSKSLKQQKETPQINSESHLL